jgi:membrane associated rhomboid family serine protease
MVIPIFDEDPLEKDGRAYVTYALIALNLIVFVIQAGADENLQQTILRNFALYPAAISGHQDTGGIIPPLATFVTYMFLHASWLHVSGNMLFLWVFGDNIEDALGALRFLVFYLLCGVAGAVAHVLTAVEPSHPLLGASGALAGVMGAYLLLRPCAKVEVLLFGAVPLKVDAFYVIGLWIALQVWNIATARHPSVAWWTHVGGLGAGALLVIVMRQPGVMLFDCMRPVPPADRRAS